MEKLAFDLRRALGGSASLYTFSHSLEALESNTAPISGPGWDRIDEDDTPVTSCHGPIDAFSMFLHVSMNNQRGKTKSTFAYAVDYADRTMTITVTMISTALTSLLIAFRPEHLLNFGLYDFPRTFGIVLFASFAFVTILGIVSSQGHRFGVLLDPKIRSMPGIQKAMHTRDYESTFPILNLIYGDDMRAPFFTWFQAIFVISVYAIGAAFNGFVLVHALIRLTAHYESIWLFSLTGYSLSMMLTSVAHCTRFDHLQKPPYAFSVWPIRMSAYRVALGTLVVPILTIGMLFMSLLPNEYGTLLDESVTVFGWYGFFRLS